MQSIAIATIFKVVYSIPTVASVHELYTTEWYIL